MSKGKLIAVLAVTFLIIYVVASPYLTVYQIKLAAEARDSAALSEHIDFGSVRQSLKDQLNIQMAQEMAADEEMQNNPFAALGAGIASAMVERIVDAYVTPSGISALMAGEKLDSENGKNEHKNSKEALKNASMAYESFSKFTVQVEDEQGDAGKFVLRRQGLEWKLTEIVIPMD